MSMTVPLLDLLEAPFNKTRMVARKRVSTDAGVVPVQYARAIPHTAQCQCHE